jgi:hypothetical protein
MSSPWYLACGKDDIIEDLTRHQQVNLESHRQVYDKSPQRFRVMPNGNRRMQRAYAKVPHRNFKSSTGKAAALPVDVARAYRSYAV